jgi:hypothetical protein
MPNIRSTLVTGAAVAAAAFGGATLANAASSATTSSSSSVAPAATQAALPANMPAHGSAAHENAEKAVTGAAAAKAKAAAVKAVGGGTASAVTTNCTGNGYEVIVIKSSGTKVEVHLDSSFNAMQFPGRPPGSNGSLGY